MYIIGKPKISINILCKNFTGDMYEIKTENTMKPIKEYNPEHARSITNGMVSPSCDIK